MATTRDASLEDWARLVEDEYREMPGLNLTKVQMQRLWGLDTTLCDSLIEAMVSQRVLRLGRGGQYVRAGCDH